jgi:lysozyme family protein
MGSTVIFIVIALALVCLVIPGSSATVPPVTPQITPFVTHPDITVTNSTLNHTLPSGYQVTPTLLNVQVELPDPALPVPKGEMAAGPRVIGFSTNPVSLAIAILAVALVAAGIGYFLKRKRDEEERE